MWLRLTRMPDGVANKTTKETKIADQFGYNVLDETYAYTGGGYSRIGWDVKVYNNRGLVTSEYNSNGTQTTATWGCCGKDSETLADGTEITYAYDLLKRGCYLFRRDAPEIEPLASREYRRRDLVGLGGGKDKLYMRRRFF